MGEPFTIKKTYTSVAEMNADFNNMQLGDYVMIASTVEVEDNAKLYTRGESQWIFITDFSGATGIRGEVGLTPNIQIGTVTQGTSFNVTRTGTNENPVLNFTLVKGDKGDVGQTGPVGATGNGIASITKTGTSGLVDTYTITYTNGNTTTFTITNGEDGEVTETELNVLREKLENQQKVIDQLPQVEGQGTSITLENTIEATFTKFDVEGNSVQDGTPSPDNEVPIYSAGDNENLFDTSLLPITKNGVTISKDSKGNVILNGTPTITSGYINFNISATKQFNAGIYTVSFAQKKVGIGSTIVGFGNGQLNLTLDETVNSKTANISNAGNARFDINVRYDVGTLDNFILNPKLEKGNKASGYSPYGMGSINEKINNKNFAWNNLGNTTLSGVTFTVNENKSITVNGTATSDVYYVLRNDLSFKAGETWSLSGCNGGSSTTYELYCYTLGDLYNGSISHTFQGDYPNRQLGIAIKSGTTLNNVTFYPQLELNSQATDYVPPQEQDYSIYTQQPFRSIGDVRDVFFKNVKGSKYYNKDLEENKWYERHYIGEKILNGTENWREYSSNMYLYIEDFILSEGQNNYVPTNYLSDHFTRNSLTNAIANPNASYLIQNIWGERNKQRGVAIRVNDTFTDLATLKTWLSTHNVVLQYELAEPLDLPCTEEQIQQIENRPSTYKDFTIIQSQDETPAYLEVSGIYDLNKLINN